MKKTAMYKRYADEKPVGAVSLCNTIGLNVYYLDEVDSENCYEDDVYVCSWCNGVSEWGFHKHKMHYTTSGRAYFRKGQLRIYLDEIMRV